MTNSGHKMFNLINSQEQQKDSQQNKNNGSNCSNVDECNIDCDDCCCDKNDDAYNHSSLTNLTNYINNNSSDLLDAKGKKKKLNYGSYYRQEKLKVTANFIEKFLKSDVSDKQQQQQPQSSNYETHVKEIECHAPSINFTYTYQAFSDFQSQPKQNKDHDCELFGTKERDLADSLFDTTESEPISLHTDHSNNFMDKNYSDTMPSLSPSQSSTDQSASMRGSHNNKLGLHRTSLTAVLTSEATNYNEGDLAESISTKFDNPVSRKKLLRLVTFLDQQNQRLKEDLQSEKKRRNEELSRIIKSLLYFEAKLKSEKKVINQKLLEKDVEIARLVKLNGTIIKKLKTQTEAHNQLEEIEIEQLKCKYPEALYCSNCHKNFYDLNERCDIWTQTNEKRGNCKADKIKSSKNPNSTEFCSSSDETLSSSFYGRRQSVRYTSKRFVTFKEYMRSRCMNIDDSNNDVKNMSDDENRSTLSCDVYPSQNKKSSIKNQYKRGGKKMSLVMERLHGVRREPSFEFDSSDAENRNLNNIQHFSSVEPEPDYEYTNSPNDEGIEDDEENFNDEDSYDEEENDDDNENEYEKSCAKKREAKNGADSNNVNLKEFAETSFKQDFETSTDDWYASASDTEEVPNNNVCRTNSYGYNAVNPVLECVNQILLQQSMEECIPHKINGLNKSARENQFEIEPISLESNDNNTGGFSTGSVSRKRVHFSTKNSMVHVPRNDDENRHKSCSFSDILTSEHQSNNLNYESIYSNEYEPIGSEHNSSNLYVDMESKLDQDEKIISKSKNSQDHTQQFQVKNPPALPPKPANLIKFKRASKTQAVSKISENIAGPTENQKLLPALKLTKELLENVNCDKNEKHASEPDYCSISEVNVAIKTMQIVADVHKSNDTNSTSSSEPVSISDNSDSISQKTLDETEEIFADIPKLPNVAAIIAPPKSKTSKKNSKFSMQTPKTFDFQQSSAIIELSPKQNMQHPQRPQTLQLYRPKSPGQVQRKHVPNILAEINKKIQQANTATITMSPTKRRDANELISALNSSSSVNKIASVNSYLGTSKILNDILLSNYASNPTMLCSSTSSKSAQNSTQSSQKNTVQFQHKAKLNNKNVCPQHLIKIEDSLPLEAEFDWYNLDAEYGKSSNRPDILKAAELRNSCATEYVLSSNGCLRERLTNDINQSVEYNLDEEFSLFNQPDIIKENIRLPEEQKKETIPGSESYSPEISHKKTLELKDKHENLEKNVICKSIIDESVSLDNAKEKVIDNSIKIGNKFATINDRTPCRESASKQKTLVEFIENAGFSNKPLPQQKKIYFTGPFV